MPHKLNQREIGLVDGLTAEICARIKLFVNDEEARSIGRCAFFEVYTENWHKFLGDGRRGWTLAADAMREKLLEYKRSLDFTSYKSRSLDAPINEETDTPLTAILRGKCGDFQESVCFWDYVDGFEDELKSVVRGLKDGYTVDEVCELQGWGRAYGAGIVLELQRRFTIYLLD